MRPLTLDLLALPKAVPELRRTVSGHLGRSCPDVQLCLTELVANVITHLGEGTPVTVRIAPTADGDRTRIEVTDPDRSGSPAPRHAADADESGRGLALLAATASRWGVTRGPADKTVWCEVPGPSSSG
ncbi:MULTISPECIES: ATP-binding protein [Streptomyces]|uniref:ATP-binding protein n=1 Tax=Streptomyces chengmaiensis TaxID=3040919 RepID=A0ABT6HQJ4_9ACTN|nr:MULTISPECIES: ATP-binding protein [Streptomyces]MDH2390987.1 ATP-binding protein [Streptomyces chengmaiensis]WRQ82405.1 ATP-binding protein [Streptomyces sp. MUM 178J]